METYSHSRLNTFEQCRLRFKFNYIDKIKTEIETTVEAFMGGMAHKALEKLYKDLQAGKLNTLKELIDFYSSEWDRSWTDGVMIVRKGLDQMHYKQLGERFIKDFYERFKPFDQDKTIATERHVMVEFGPFKIQGYIDRISTKGDTYSIHDYKTSSRLPTTDQLKMDRQLKIYAIALKQLYQDCKKVKLVWHYLAFDKDLTYEPTDKELKEVEKEVIGIIEEVEAATEYPAKTSALCGWCQFQPICPEWKHKFEVKQKDLQDFMLDDGVGLVNRYAELKEKMEKYESYLEDAKQKLVEYAEKKELNAVFGSGVKAAIRTYPRLSFPKKGDSVREPFIKVVKEIGLWDQLVMPDVYELAKLINSGDVHPDLVKLLDPFIKRSKTTIVYLNRQ
ncbi:MAG: PD-(D/E)XK nuclease family protein [Nanoarchaeota archaeon]|nr:PD-(D/E)XK nuclease family protein [Nanoarchaeota archaeon]